MSVKAGVVGLTAGDIDYTPDPESAKWSVDDTEKESIPGPKGRIGTMQKGAVPFIEVKVWFDEAQDAAPLQVVEPGPVVLRLLDRTISLADAAVVGRIEVDAKDNSSTVRFEGRSGTEVR